MKRVQGERLGSNSQSMSSKKIPHPLPSLASRFTLNGPGIDAQADASRPAMTCGVLGLLCRTKRFPVDPSLFTIFSL